MVNIFWFRRDLRLKDNAGLYQALKGDHPVVPVFIFDTDILDQLEDKDDRRVEFIHAAITEMQAELLKMKSTLEVYHGKPVEVFKNLMEKHAIGTVFTNHDYEPYAQRRDAAVIDLLAKQKIGFQTYKDQVIFEKDEVMKDNGEAYTIFTPYSRKWKSTLTKFYLKAYPNEKYFANFHRQPRQSVPSLEDLGFAVVDLPFPSRDLKKEIIKKYDKQRDYPGIEGTSKLGVHLRFGTISIREVARIAGSLNEIYLNELIWRDFYQMLLWNIPQIGEGKACKPEFDGVRWRNDEKEFESWTEGRTGYPLVDAGMRELNATGYMHNRVRMVVASFLSKHLLIDWRWGEAYFARRLLDFDMASNNGGWQWAAGSGCDASPYFRIFNPTLQAKKFDPQLTYIRRWVPELDSFDYPKPLVEHEFARARCLEVFGKAVGRKLASR